MIPAEYVFNAIVVSVHDGDTINCEISRGMFDYAGSQAHPVPVRLAGCNARELSVMGGPEARDHLAALLPPGTAIVLHTVRPDKYAPRWDAYVETVDGDLTAAILAEWAAAWSGSGTAPLPPWPRTVA